MPFVEKNGTIFKVAPRLPRKSEIMFALKKN